VETIEKKVAAHYGDNELLNRILSGLELNGVDLNAVETDDLVPCEEFHIGGRLATEFAVNEMQLTNKQHVLDVGCGIGGAVRYIAKQVGCKVSGIDLTPEYISVAKALTKLTRLDSNVNFDVASALDMPFENAAFDAAITLHVAMNIKERSKLYDETFRVLKPGAVFCLFDVMQTSDEPLTYPVPWAVSDETSHLTTPSEMQRLLEASGFSLLSVIDRKDFALDFFQQKLAAKNPNQALGLHTIMIENGAEKLKNIKENIEKGCVSPVQMIAVRN